MVVYGQWAPFIVASPCALKLTPYYGAQNHDTHILWFGGYFPNYTGHLSHRSGSNYFVWFGPLHRYFLWMRQLHINCLGIHFPIAHICYIKELFRDYLCNRFSRGIKRDKLNGTNRAEFADFRRFSLIFADFHFSWEVKHFGSADFRRKPQETTDFRRKPQETADFCRNRFVPFSLSLLIPP